MMNIKPISELRNYSKILDDVKPSHPLFLTKNGYGKYAVIDIDEYERLKLGLDLLNDLEKTKSDKTHNASEVLRELGL
ncbi:type II toxin-antitoxin system Phd/YefM family antitoxin [Enterococcus termitis]|uniref:Antitoxin n=1 Tax=Enterococcus termitis TaxID=332950 RepID=A0A1E5GJ58_9ENTE|nr:type II toxin-antitoxin system Phd/YefM family antitoxin [Enterococcus termitis]OEG12756.1 prevent-host-death protein [Enterococcus termitis]